VTDRTDDSPQSTAPDPYGEATFDTDGFDRSPRAARANAVPDEDDDALDAGDPRRTGSADSETDERAVSGRAHAVPVTASRDRIDSDSDRNADDDAQGDAPPADREQLSARAHVNGLSTGLPAPTGTEETASPRGHGVSYGVGPFSVREVSLLGVWAVAFLVSFFPDNNVAGSARLLLGGTNVWLSGLWWIPAIALPTVAVGLVVLRRLSPQGIRRVGSLGIDQFASVAFSVAALVWVAWVWDTVSIAAETGGWVRGWVVWVEAVLMVAGVVLTVVAPFIPPFASDFVGREEVSAHRLARPIRPVVPRPRTPRPRRRSTTSPGAATHESSGPDTVSPGSYTGSTDAPRTAVAEPATSVLPAHDDTAASERAEDSTADDRGSRGERSDDRTVPGDDHPTDVITSVHDASHGSASAPHAAAQAFWALAPVERDVVDDYGTPIFRIGPSAWALVIEDRGETFVIRHDDGRIGYLHDVSGVTRG